MSIGKAVFFAILLFFLATWIQDAIVRTMKKKGAGVVSRAALLGRASYLRTYSSLRGIK